MWKGITVSDKDGLKVRWGCVQGAASQMAGARSSEFWVHAEREL